jgi:forkhead transcription factor HCM1
MASTRYSQQPLQIYQDPVTSFDHAPMPSTQKPSNLRRLSPLRPMKNDQSRKNIILNPPQAGPSRQSPLKSAQQSSSSPSRAPFSSKLNMISMPPPGGPTYSTDSIEKKQPLMSKFKPQKTFYASLEDTKPAGKENYPGYGYQKPQTSYDGLSSTNFSLEGLYPKKTPLKRTLLDAAPLNESRPLKKSRLEESPETDESQPVNELPPPNSFPSIHDDGSKPPQSYAQLIAMSILRAPNRRLTLAQIYKWISDTYAFYSSSEPGWQNSIRHNLSLNKAFIKQERPKDDPGKGNYWAIQPGTEAQFLKDKSMRRINDNSLMLSNTFAPVSQADSARTRHLSPPPSELPTQSIYSPHEPEPVALPEISSDATIPASDVINHEEEEAEEEEVQRLPVISSPPIRSSSPAAMMHSSPPIARHVSRRQDTPPPVPRFPSSSRTRSHKRKFASMDDSGYISSLESSAMRPHAMGRLLTSEADRPRIKRGRAEEEIARLRGSSYDSPPKARTMST